MKIITVAMGLPTNIVSVYCIARVGLDTTGELGYDRPVYNGLSSMTDDKLGPSPMHIKYVSYVSGLNANTK